MSISLEHPLAKHVSVASDFLLATTNQYVGVSRVRRHCRSAQNECYPVKYDKSSTTIGRHLLDVEHNISQVLPTI